jgi:Transposase DDE domain
MDDKILPIYCLCADVVKATGHTEASQQRMSDAEVISTGLVAMLCLRGNFESARALLRAPRYILHMLSRSRVNRRPHRLKELLVSIFELLGETWKHLNIESVYITDSFPIAVCDHDRIPRVKLYKHEVHRGYIASKKRYFYGLKIRLMVTKEGQPVECFLTPGSSSDVMSNITIAKGLKPSAAYSSACCPKRFMRSRPRALS